MKGNAMKKYSVTTIVFTVLRVLLGVFAAYSGAQFLFHLGVMPAPTDPLGQQLMGSMAATYLLTFVKLTEFVGGLLLLWGRTASLGLIVLTPVTLNILLFNMTLNPGMIGLAAVLVLIQIALFWYYRAKFLPLFSKDTPAATPTN